MYDPPLDIYVFVIDHPYTPSFFVYPSSSKLDIDGIREECKLLYGFPITQFVETIPSYDIMDVDRIVKAYMLDWGIENIRGGTYSCKVLPEYMVKTLEDELEYIRHGMEKQKKTVEDLVAFQQTISLDTIEATKIQLQKKLLDYKYAVNELTRCNKNLFDLTLLSEFDWIKSTVEEIHEKGHSDTPIHLFRTDPELFERYQRLIVRIKHMVNIYGSIRENVNASINLLHPDFILDKYFLHCAKIVQRDVNEWNEFYKSIMSIFYIVKKYIDELEFDVSAYPKDTEEKLNLKLRLLMQEQKKTDLSTMVD